MPIGLRRGRRGRRFVATPALAASPALLLGLGHLRFGDARAGLFIAALTRRALGDSPAVPHLLIIGIRFLVFFVVVVVVLERGHALRISRITLHQTQPLLLGRSFHLGARVAARSDVRSGSRWRRLLRAVAGQLPVVLVTALESREDRERGVDAGANAYIVKGRFDQSDLLEALRRLI